MEQKLSPMFFQGWMDYLACIRSELFPYLSVLDPLPLIFMHVETFTTDCLFVSFTAIEGDRSVIFLVDKPVTGQVFIPNGLSPPAPSS